MNIADIIGTIGYLGLTSAFIICAGLILTSVFSHLRRFSALSRKLPLLIHSQTVMLAIAVISLFILLNIEAFQFEQVFNAVELNMQPIMRMGGLWSGQAASLLFWSFVMSLMISISALVKKSEILSSQYKTVVLILSFSLIFFLAPDIFVSNPFEKIYRLPAGDIITATFPPQNATLLVPIDGQGLNPSLRHIAMLLHPPTLYIGLTGLFLPYAFGLAALLHRDTTNAWVFSLFPIALIAWIFLTLGMFLGSWWAYTILGWGGYWGWDAVEISGLLPWLLSFGLLHAMRLSMRGKSMAKWLNFFAFSTVILIHLGILITRSGILESVHAYASGPMGPILTMLIISQLITISIALAINSRNKESKATQLKSDLTRIINHLFFWCLIGLVVIYLFGQTLPLTSNLIIGKTIVFTPSDYERFSAPLLFLLLALMAICPFTEIYQNNKKTFYQTLGVLGTVSLFSPLAILFFTSFSFRKLIGFWITGFLFLCWLTSLFNEVLIKIIKGKSWKKWNKKLGMVIIHLGFSIMAIGIIGVETMARDYSLVLTPGRVETIENLSIRYQPDLSIYDDIENPTYTASLAISRDNNSDVDLQPSIIHYWKTGTFYKVPAIKPGFFSDIQIILEEFPISNNSPINLHIAIFPLITWIWVGGGLMTIGGTFSIIIFGINHKHKNVIG